MRKITLILILALFPILTLSACGKGFVPFESLPDADLDDPVFQDMIAKYSRYSYMYRHFMLSYVNDNSTEFGGLTYDLGSAGSKLYEQTYENWKQLYPDKTQYVEDNFDKLLKMTLNFRYSNRIQHFEAMKKVVESYVKYAYQNLTPAQAFDEDDAQTNNFMSDAFLAKDPQTKVQTYLAENNIHVKDIIFNEIFASFEQHNYPFRIVHRFKIRYYIGDVAPENGKLASADIEACYLVGINDAGDYIVEYVSDVRYFRETIEDGEMMVEDIMRSEE